MYLKCENWHIPISFQDHWSLPWKVDIYCHRFNKNDSLVGVSGLQTEIHGLENSASQHLGQHLPVKFSFSLRAADPSLAVNFEPDLQIAVS